MQIPSPDNNIVELQLIKRGRNLVTRQYDTAGRIEKEVSTTFYTRVNTVQKWIENASSNSHLFVYAKAKETTHHGTVVLNFKVCTSGAFGMPCA
jgi:hypothetical protein